MKNLLFSYCSNIKKTPIKKIKTPVLLCQPQAGKVSLTRPNFGRRQKLGRQNSQKSIFRPNKDMTYLGLLKQTQLPVYHQDKK